MPAVLKSRLPAPCRKAGRLRLVIKQAQAGHAPTLAVDLDGTLAPSRRDLDLAHIKPREGAREALERFRGAGMKVLLWTSRNNLAEVRDWLDAYGIPYDALNANPDHETGSRKIPADVYLDDHGAYAGPERSWDDMAHEVFARVLGEPRQPAEDYDELVAMADGGASAELAALLVGATAFPAVRLAELPLGGLEAELAAPGGKVVLGPVKARGRAAEKVNADYGGDWSRLLDVVRAAVAVDTSPAVYEAAAAVRRAGGVLAREPKDRFREPLANGYRDLLANYRLPCGLICEVQYHVKPMLLARERERLAYDVVRAIKASLAEEGRETMTPGEAEACRRAREDSRRLFARAWEECQQRQGIVTTGILEPVGKALGPVNRLAEQKAERWVTLDPSGTHVRLDDSGKVTAGPGNLTGHPVNRLPGRKPKRKPGRKPAGKPAKPAAAPTPPPAPPPAPRPAFVTDRKNADLPDGSRSYLDTSTPEELSGLRDYTGGKAFMINGALRQGWKLMPKDQAIHQAVQGLFAKNPDLPEPVTVHRGMSMGPEAAEHFIAGLRQAADKGEPWTSPSYVSTTTAAADVKGKPVEMTIRAVNGVDTLPLTKGDPDEKELLLNAGSQFRVGKITRTAAGYHVELEQLPPGRGGAPAKSLGLPPVDITAGAGGLVNRLPSSTHKAGGSCKPGQTAARTDCMPVTGGGAAAAAPPAEPEPPPEPDYPPDPGDAPVEPAEPDPADYPPEPDPADYPGGADGTAFADAYDAYDAEVGRRWADYERDYAQWREGYARWSEAEDAYHDEVARLDAAHAAAVADYRQAYGAWEQGGAEAGKALGPVNDLPAGARKDPAGGVPCRLPFQEK